MILFTLFFEKSVAKNSNTNTTTTDGSLPQVLAIMQFILGSKFKDQSQNTN